MSRSDFFIRREALELRYDGPIPPADPASAGRPAARARLFGRLAREAVRNTAIRRAKLPAEAAIRDDRLGQLSGSVGFYRTHGVAWISRRCDSHHR